MTKIRIVGLTGGGSIGAYETQLGNAAILIPMIKLMKSHIPEMELSTTIQLTDRFCQTHGIDRISNTRRLIPRFDRELKVLIACFDLLRTSLWRLLKNLLHLNPKVLIRGKYLEMFADSDLVLDFNGDIFPSDTRAAIVLSHALQIATIRKLGVPVVEFVSSPGPFNTWFRRFVSRFMFKRISVFANRERTSATYLKQIGIERPIVNTACPAFLLEPVSGDRAKELLLKEKVIRNDRPLIGITLCGYNLPSQHTWGMPESFDDLTTFVPALKWLLDDLNATVFLLPHVYRMNPYTYAHEHINGPDYDICSNLFEMVEGNKYDGRLRLIQGKYTPSEAKGIIGQCDMYISGRLHAAVCRVIAIHSHSNTGLRP